MKHCAATNVTSLQFQLIMCGTISSCLGPAAEPRRCVEDERRFKPGSKQTALSFKSIHRSISVSKIHVTFSVCTFPLKILGFIFMLFLFPCLREQTTA